MKTLKAVKTQDGWQVTVTESFSWTVNDVSRQWVSKAIKKHGMKITSKYSSKATRGLFQVITAEKE